MIIKKNMTDCVYRQLAVDYNCSPDDFFKDCLIFTEARKIEGRRHFPFITPRLERNPETTFVITRCGSCSENLG